MDLDYELIERIGDMPGRLLIDSRLECRRGYLGHWGSGNALDHLVDHSAVQDGISSSGIPLRSIREEETVSVAIIVGTLAID